MARSNASDRFRVAAADLGIDVEPLKFPEETRTAVAAAAAIGCDVAQIVKSLVFATPEGVVLALTSGANRVDTNALGALVGTTIDRADADTVRSATGFSIGGTPPFGHPSPIPTYIDTDLLDHATVWAAAGAPDTVFPMAPDRLIVVTDGVVADFAER